jgi:hypothetical protein
MSPAPEIRSRQPDFVVPGLGRKSPKFVFVTINDPKDIRNPRKQTIIRSHARKDAGRKERKREGFIFVHERGTPTSAVDTLKSIPVDPARTAIPALESLGSDETENKSLDNHPDILPLLSITSLRPLGAGRGYNPFASFPIEPTPRVVQLIDSCKPHKCVGE